MNDNDKEKNKQSVILLDTIVKEIFNKCRSTDKFETDPLTADPPFKDVRRTEIFNDYTIRKLFHYFPAEPPIIDEVQRFKKLIAILENNKYKWTWKKLGVKTDFDYDLFRNCKKTSNECYYANTDCKDKCNDEYKNCPRRVIYNILQYVDNNLRKIAEGDFTEYIHFQKLDYDPKLVNEMQKKIDEYKISFKDTKIKYYDKYSLKKELEIISYAEKLAKMDGCTKELAYIKWYIAHLKTWMGIKKVRTKKILTSFNSKTKKYENEEKMFIKFIPNNTNDEVQIYFLLFSSFQIIKQILPDNKEITIGNSNSIETNLLIVHIGTDLLMSYLEIMHNEVSIPLPPIDDIEHIAENLTDDIKKSSLYLALWLYTKETEKKESNKPKKYDKILNNLIEKDRNNLQQIQDTLRKFDNVKEYQDTQERLEELKPKLYMCSNTPETNSEYCEVKKILNSINNDENIRKYKETLDSAIEIEMLDLEYHTYQYIFYKNHKKNEKGNKLLNNIVKERQKIEELSNTLLKLGIIRSKHLDTFLAILTLLDTTQNKNKHFISFDDEEKSVRLLPLFRPELPPIDKTINTPDSYKRIWQIKGIFSICPLSTFAFSYDEDYWKEHIIEEVIYDNTESRIENTSYAKIRY